MLPHPNTWQIKPGGSSMPTFTCVDGQSLQIGDITVTVLDVAEDEVLVSVDCPEGSIIEPSNSELVMQSAWRLD
jgi:hypothetical protein